MKGKQLQVKRKPSELLSSDFALGFVIKLLGEGTGPLFWSLGQLGDPTIV